MRPEILSGDVVRDWPLLWLTRLGVSLRPPGSLLLKIVCLGVKESSELGAFDLGSTAVRSGVLTGVELVLSTRAFREFERGVTLAFKKALTGVDRTSGDASLARLDCAFRHKTGVLGDDSGAANRGVNGDLVDLFWGLRVVAINGREERLLMCCLSKAIFP